MTGKRACTACCFCQHGYSPDQIQLSRSAGRKRGTQNSAWVGKCAAYHWPKHATLQIQSSHLKTILSLASSGRISHVFHSHHENDGKGFYIYTCILLKGKH